MVLRESDLDELEEGDIAPDFELEGADGETYSLDSFDDKKGLLVVFTCNHCPYAKAKIPVLNELADGYDDVAVVGINPNDAENYPEDSFEKMKEVVDDGTVRYDAYLRDETQEVAKEYAATCTPDPYLFENDGGEFRLVYHGRLDDAPNPEDEPTENFMKQAIDSVLSGGEVGLEWLPSQGCSIKWKE